MPKLKPVKPRILIKLLRELGYKQCSQSRGSHWTFIKGDDPNTLVQVVMGHETVPVGTLSRFLKKIGVSRDEFLKFLGKKK